MPKHAAEPELDDLQTRLDRAALRVRGALQEYLDLQRGATDGAVVLDWAAAVEWSNPEAERRRASGKMTVCETDRISDATIKGLGLYLAGLSR